MIARYPLATLLVIATLTACGAPPVTSTPTSVAPTTAAAINTQTETVASTEVAAATQLPTDSATDTATASSDSTAAVTAPTDAAVADDVAFPRTLTHSLGTITIPAKPQRVVTLSDGDTDAAIALGITPVAILANAYTADGIAPWLVGKIDTSKTQIMPYSEALPIEQIATFQPDLILAGSHFDISNVYEQLSQIAPTTSWITASFEDSWDAQAMFAAQALGEGAAMARIIKDTTDSIAQLRTDYPQLSGKTFSLSLLHSPSALGSINTQQDFAVQFFQSLGLQLTPKLTELANTQQAFQAALSLEQLNFIDADLTILSFYTPDLQAQLETNPIFQKLGAVKDDRIVLVDLPTIAQMCGPTLLGIPWLIDGLRPALAKLAAEPAATTATTEATEIAE